MHQPGEHLYAFEPRPTTRRIFEDCQGRGSLKVYCLRQSIGPKHRHVLAAAIACRANYLVTFNLKDFPTSSVKGLGTTVISPSLFLKQLWILDRSIVERRLEEQAEAIGVSVDLLFDRLARSVPGFVKALRRV